MNRKNIFFTLFTASLCYLSPIMAQDAVQTAQQKVTVSTQGNRDKKIKLGGWVDAQYRFEADNSGEESCVFQIRRARMDLKGDLSSRTSFRLQADFAQSPKLIDAFMIINVCKQVRIQAGQFKIPFSLENKLSPLELELTENAQAIGALSGYKDVTGINQYANGRDIGVMIEGTLGEYETTSSEEKMPILRYAAGIFGGNGINVKSDNLAKDVSARIEFSPFVRHFFLSASGYWGKYDMEEAGVSTHTDGDRIRYACGMQYADNHWTLRGEYLWGKTDFAKLDEAGVFYTGMPIYSRGFYLTGGYWFQLGKSFQDGIAQRLRPVVRFDYYEKDHNTDAASIYYAAGAEWWPTNYLRFQLAYSLQQHTNNSDLAHCITTMASVKF